MTFRFPIQCDICERKILTKVQAGYLKESQVRIACPNCASILKGELLQIPPGVALNFNNASNIGNDNLPDDITVIPISTELPIPEEASVSIGKDSITLSPYMALSKNLKFDKVHLFRDRYLEFVKYRDDKIDALENIISLCQAEKWEYVVKQSRKNFSDKIIFLKKELDYDRATSFYVVSLLLKDLILTTIPKNYEDSYTIRLLLKKTLNQVQKEKNTLENLKNELNKYFDLDREFISAAKILISFIRNTPAYAPVICLTYESFEEEFRSKYKITTFSFDDLKEHYKDSFELISRASIIYIGFSNYNSNGDVNNFSGINNCNSLKEFFNLSNGLKKGVLENYPFLKKYFRGFLDNQLRNAIGHTKTEYLNVEQMVRYYPYSDLRKINRHKEKSLVDFAYQTLALKLMILDLIIFLGKWKYRFK